jgi:23S rRNA (uracil747-C5)-methyltransferase
LILSDEDVMSMTFCSEYYDREICRSCSRIQVPYAEQIQEKERRLVSSLAPIFGLDAGDFPWVSTALSEEQAFRNRAKLTITGSLDQPVIGLPGEGSSPEELDRGRELLRCPIHRPELNVVIALLPEFIRKARLVPYSIASRKGELKGVILFVSEESGEIYLRFILRSRESLFRLKKELPFLQEAFPALKCVSANLQPVPHAILEGPEEIYLTEDESGAGRSIEHRIGGIPFELSPQAFVQTNAGVARALYSTAAEWVKESGSKRFLELFSGQGPFSFFAASEVKSALGVEINADAVRVANATAQRLGYDQLRFECMDATKVGSIVAEYREDIVLVNPPRRGLADGIRLFQESPPRHFFYSSCSIESLERDLKTLIGDSGFRPYSLRRARLFDMFPHTNHFEALVWLERTDSGR